jgi:hypothetical protein
MAHDDDSADAARAPTRAAGRVRTRKLGLTVPQPTVGATTLPLGQRRKAVNERRPGRDAEHGVVRTKFLASCPIGKAAT